MRSEAKSQQALAKGVQRFLNKDYFDALKSFSKATVLYDVEKLTPDLS